MAAFPKARFRKAHLAGLLAVLTGAGVLAACGTDSTSSSSGKGGGTTIQIWEGYTQVEAKAFAHLVSSTRRRTPARR